MIRVGQKLQEERLKKGLTIEQVAKATRIRASFLTAIEDGDYGKLPSSTYAAGFVRNYVQFLNMPPLETLALFRREFSEEKVFKVLPEGLSKKEGFPIKKIRFKNTIKIVIAAILLLLIYILFQYRFAFINPKLEVLSPKEGEIISSENITVLGKTDPNTSVFVNNQPASLRSDGKFSKIVSSFTGKITITIKAVNNFGRQKLLERHITVKFGK